MPNVNVLLAYCCISYAYIYSLLNVDMGDGLKGHLINVFCNFITLVYLVYDGNNLEDCLTKLSLCIPPILLILYIM